MVEERVQELRRCEEFLKAAAAAGTGAAAAADGASLCPMHGPVAVGVAVCVCVLHTH